VRFAGLWVCGFVDLYVKGGGGIRGEGEGGGGWGRRVWCRG